MPEALQPPIEPMEARAAEVIPRGPNWQYEPKWDGFRAIAFRDGASLQIQSKSGRPLERYFPEVVSALLTMNAPRFVLDGELVIDRDGRADFDALLQRIHPAARRIERLARETPARYVVFDLLADELLPDWYTRALRERREALEQFAARHFGDLVGLSPASTQFTRACEWFERGAPWFDGVLAKAIDAPYEFGGRHRMVKIKPLTTVDCVVGGYRTASTGGAIASLLLGLYDEAGRLNAVGFLAGLNAAERRHAGELVRPLAGRGGFTGALPGGPSRWGARDSAWIPLEPQLVVEVRVDHTPARRFRHGARFMRWRPDKDPRACTMDQIFRV